MSKRSLVVVVDDDGSVRESLPILLRLSGFEVAAFASAEEYLVSSVVNQTACLILDVRMPGMTGLELQQELTRRKLDVPIVFITSGSTERVRAEVMRRGAVACLFKPFSEEAIIEAVDAALRRI
jgi:FixJ family two-component response regulator